LKDEFEGVEKSGFEMKVCVCVWMKRKMLRNEGKVYKNL